MDGYWKEKEKVRRRKERGIRKEEKVKGYRKNTQDLDFNQLKMSC